LAHAKAARPCGPLFYKKSAEIIHVGTCRSRNEQIAREVEGRPRIMARQERARIAAGAPDPRHRPAVTEGASIVFGAVDTVGISGHRYNAIDSL